MKAEVGGGITRSAATTSTLKAIVVPKVHRKMRSRRRNSGGLRFGFLRMRGRSVIGWIATSLAGERRVAKKPAR
jgi:hypothetical protein